MELDLKGKRKYKLSHGSTPSPTDSEAGNYFRNLAFRPSSTDDGASGKRISSIQFDTGRYDPHDNDDVFVISHSDSSVYSQKSKHKVKRVESNRTGGEESQTKARTRKICFLIIFLIVVLGLIAGIAVIVVFYVINLNDSTETTQSTVSPTTPQNPVILESSIRLKNGWSDDLYNSSSDFYKTFSQNYTEEIDSLMHNSNKSQFYIGVTVLDFSPGSIFVHSELSFFPEIYTVFTDVVDLSTSVTDVIVLESSLGQTTLLIDASEVYVSDKCSSLDYSTCSSFHNTTSFPNFYGQKSYGAAVTYFQNDLQPIIDIECSSVATFFFCGLNFPKCYKARQILPCRSVCEKLNSECSKNPEFNSFDCLSLVDSSDPNYCLVLPPETTTTSTTVAMTTTQTTTDTMTTEDPNTTITTEATTSMTTDAATTTMTTEATTTTVTTEATTTTMTTEATTITEQTIMSTEPTTTTPKELCEDVQASECLEVGITRTTFDNFYGQDSQSKALETFYKYINDSCSKNATLLYCNLFFPRCGDDGKIENPCKSLCRAGLNECGTSIQLVNEEVCNGHSFLDTLCVEPLPSPTPPPVTSITPPALCEDVQYPACQQFNNYTVYPNLWTNDNHETAVLKIQGFMDEVIATNCSANALNFFCSSTFLPCDLSTGLPKYPCKSLCEAVVRDCNLSSTRFPCHNLRDSNCVPIIEDKPNCTETGQLTCPDGSCIMSEWLCDGEADCPSNWDEQNCSKCTIDEFRCKDGTCINSADRCNWVPECPDQSDERDCVHLSELMPGVLMVAYKNYHIPVCYEGWSDTVGPFTCVYTLGNKAYTNSSGTVYPANLYAHFVALPEAGSIASTIGGHIIPKSTCKDNKVVSLECEPKGCGQKLIGSGMIGYIVNGHKAAPGAWPWQAALELQVKSTTEMLRKHLCGGVLIKPNFVLTATHCVAEYTDKSLYRVILGASNRETLSSATKTYRVERVVQFDEKWYNFKKGDLTLLELNETVVYSPYIQPICLPSDVTPTPTTAICYGTGWGQLTGEKNGNFSPDLQELKLKLWNTDKCNSSKAWNGLIDKGYICAGYESGVRSMCSGDSGGPMVCKDNQNNWYLTGIASYVSNYCNMTQRPNVFTDVKYFLGWINNNTECIFTCTNGKCLYNQDLICNREDNCGDNSDETVQCDVSVSCTFDDDFMCGYKLDGFEQHRPILESQTPQTLPAYDHTYGKYPGYYMAGKSTSIVEARMTSPRFSVSGNSCLRFYYNLRGDLNAGLRVRLTPYFNGQAVSSAQMWSSGEGKFSDQWRLGYFDLSIGTFDIIFIASDLMKVAIDDVALHDGLCGQSVCTPNEYKCTSDIVTDTCISHDSICDVVKDCHSDELNCNYDFTSYRCGFEYANVCGIRQETFDNGEWLLINQTYTRSTVLYSDSFPDHTTGTDEGYFLFLMVNALFQGEFVGMSMNVALHEKEFCLSFWYRSVTEATFKVDIANTTSSANLWQFTDRLTNDWTKAQIQLPPLDDATIKFIVVRERPPKHGYIKPHLALDDIHIDSGVCPNYACPENWTRCRNENFCFSPAQKCDRKLQCSDETDELNCDCTASEFQCTNGRCIPLEQKCDLVTQCLDGSDEGSKCDSLKAVSCDFESPYLCGYHILSNASNTDEYKWQRKSGQTPSFYTGPNTDHTTGSIQGHYLYAEANSGRQGDQAIMKTIFFLTTVDQSLAFFYHMFFKDITLTGGLQVAVQSVTTDSQSVVWFQNTSTGEPWQLGCIDLPANQNVSVIFIANRYPNPSIQDADIAVDDITLKTGACDPTTDVETTEGRTPATTTQQSTGCKADEFRCNDGFCLEQNYLCDAIDDCFDGEDEKNCGS